MTDTDDRIRLKDSRLTDDECVAMWKVARDLARTRDDDVLLSALYHDHADARAGRFSPEPHTMTDTDEMRINFERAVHRVHGAAVFRIYEEHRRVELGEDRDHILAAHNDLDTKLRACITDRDALREDYRAQAERIAKLERVAEGAGDFIDLADRIGWAAVEVSAAEHRLRAALAALEASDD